MLGSLSSSSKGTANTTPYYLATANNWQFLYPLNNANTINPNPPLGAQENQGMEKKIINILFVAVVPKIKNKIRKL